MLVQEGNGLCPRAAASHPGRHSLQLPVRAETFPDKAKLIPCSDLRRELRLVIEFARGLVPQGAESGPIRAKFPAHYPVLRETADIRFASRRLADGADAQRHLLAREGEVLVRDGVLGDELAPR